MLSHCVLVFRLFPMNVINQALKSSLLSASPFFNGSHFLGDNFGWTAAARARFRCAKRMTDDDEGSVVEVLLPHNMLLFGFFQWGEGG